MIVSVNESGDRIGESHRQAVLTDREVDLVRVLHEKHGMSYGYLAEKFDQHKGTIAKICRYERRGQTAARFKYVQD